MVEIPKVGIVEHLKQLRHEWSDEFPDTIIFGDSGIKSKARKSWLVFVTAEAQNALDFDAISTPEATRAARELIAKFTSKEYIERSRSKDSLTQKEDVAEANRLLDIILSC